MTEDDGRSDDYWMGVRDALRMVDSFLKWSQKNRSRAKNLEDFIHDGLIAAAKRWESCLSEKLGVKFDSEHESEEAAEPPADFESTPTTLSDAAVDAFSESSPEEAHSYDEEEDVESELDEEGITVDNMERATEDRLADIDVEGPSRDFTSDFELVEPAPLVINEAEELPEDEEQEEELAPASFTWSEYEEAVTPSEEPVAEDDSEEDEADFPREEPPEVWNPYDEPSISEEELTKETRDEPVPDIESLDDDEEMDDETEAPISPPPPPPPESDEDEEERKRRARRLFFGA